MDVLNKEKMEENAFECVMPIDELLDMILSYSDTLFWYIFWYSDALIIMDNSFGETNKMPLFSIDYNV